MAQADVVVIKTDRSPDKIIRLIRDDVFGKYPYTESYTKLCFLSAISFQLKEGQTVLKLIANDAVTMYKQDVYSHTVIQALGKIIKSDMFRAYMVVERTETGMEYWKWDKSTMRLAEHAQDPDGTKLTAVFLKKFGVDMHEAWVQARDRYDMEQTRLKLVEGKILYGERALKAKWDEKYKTPPHETPSLVFQVNFLKRSEPDDGH